MSPAGAAPVSQSYSTPVRNPLVTPQLTYVTPYGIDSGRRQRDRERDQEDDSGVAISLGDASIQLGGRPRKKLHHHKGPPRGRLVKDTIIRERSPGARSAPPVGVVRDTLVREVLYDQFKDDYAKLFYKGALLIGALALLPAAATVPLAAGRRRRSLFDAEVAAGAELPAELRRQLGAALPELAQLDTSECLQRELCRALRQVEASPYRDSFLLYYAV
ncbi:hypothetical protein FJT64_019694 [Amphibalanus amphitrite]|uniref:Uncharacterized protein n=1 Tax=Amphibalanus amphitrite TaxID=1232801 RepID=A0A6A4WZ87_AMPAM|nr:hypothetical protein FJT64_019694 [Amphibalanus amphitrite]